MISQGKSAVVEDILPEKGSKKNTPAQSRLQTPAASNAPTPAGSGAEEANGAAKPIVKKKKKMTRNQQKAQEERRRLRKLRWLSEGGVRPEDTDSEVEP